MQVRVYAGQTVDITLCGSSSASIRADGRAAQNFTGPGGSCESCSNSTFASGLRAALDFTVTHSGECDPDVFVEKDSSKWVNGGPVISCVANCSTNHVYGGDVVVNPIDFMVSLQIPAGSHYCGGSLIAPGIVLTAAHCVSGVKPDMHGFQWLVDNTCSSRDCMSALVGAVNYKTGLAGGPALRASAGRVKVSYGDWISHPLYDPVTFAHDVAMVRLTGSMEYVEREYAIGPWSPTPVSTAVPTLAALGVLGWGLDETGRLSTLLRNATMPFVSRKLCTSQYGSSQVTNDTVCAGSPYQTDTCSGDSGGPLIIMAGNDGTYFGPQAGIVSHGVPRCGGAAFPGVYTSTADPVNRDWILYQLNVWAGPTLNGSSFAAIPQSNDLTIYDSMFSLIPLLVAVLNLAVFFVGSRKH